MGIPILGEARDRAMALDLSRAFVPIVNAAFDGHNKCRESATQQIVMEVERGAKEGHGGNALYIAMKELELAIHSQAMAASVNTFAILAALGVPVPVPVDELPQEGQENAS